MRGGTLKPTWGSSGWQHFLTLASDRRFLAIPFITWAIIELALVLGGPEIKSAIEFLTNK
jgi:hypothetical protein